MLHSDNVATYYITNLGGGDNLLTMEQLNIILVYGVGSLILIILPVIVISLYEMREVKKSQFGGIDVLLNGLLKTFIYSLLFLLFIMIFMMAFVGASGGKVSPAMGIYYFFFVDWLDTGVMTSIEASSSFTDNLNKKEAAMSIVAILSLIRFVYILLLMSFFLTMMAFATSLVKISARGSYEENNTVEYVLGLLIATVMSTLVFWVLIWMMSEILNGIIFFSEDTLGKHSTGVDVNKKINIVNDLVSLFRIGGEYLASELAPAPAS